MIKKGVGEFQKVFKTTQNIDKIGVNGREWGIRTYRGSIYDYKTLQMAYNTIVLKIG